jgi:hypothetical protein
MAESKSSITTVIAVLGWVVATISLTLNYLDYTAKSEEREILRNSTPTYSVIFSPLNLRSFPKEIQEIKKPVQQPFLVKHERGGAIQGLRLTFQATNGGLKNVVIEEGATGIRQELQNSGKELVLEKSSLLQGDKVSGYLVTDGLIEVSFRAGAEKGQELKREILGSYPPWYEQNFFIAIVLLTGLVTVVIGVLFALYKLSPVILKILEGQAEPDGRGRVLLISGIVLLMFFGHLLPLVPSVTQIFYAVLLYLLVTNLKNIGRLFGKETPSQQLVHADDTG